MEVAAQPESVLTQLERMLAHLPLVTSPSLSRFLRFIVGETLAGRGESITENSLAALVFDRPGDFNRRTDPIVRVQAHYLRARIARYYAGPGAADSLRIELPGRTYIPVFRTVAQPESAPHQSAPSHPDVATKLRRAAADRSLATFAR